MRMLQKKYIGIVLPAVSGSFSFCTEGGTRLYP